MRIEQIDTSSPKKVIHSIWMIRMEKEKLQEGYYFFPDNHAEIIVSLKGSFQRSIVGGRKTTKVLPGESILTRTRNRGMVLSGNDDIRLLIIKLQPQYLGLFSCESAYRFKEEIQTFSLPSEYKWDWKHAIVNNQPEELAEIFEQYSEELQHQGKKQIDRLIDETIMLIKHNKGEIKIKELYELFGVCKSTLEQKFNKEIGLSPKEFCKIEKLNHFLKNYEEFKSEMSLTQLTFKSGYYDQSHLIKDFKYYVDDSPKRFLTKANLVSLHG